MMSEKITRELDAVAEELITADLNNLQDLGRLITCFQTLLQIVADCGCRCGFKACGCGHRTHKRRYSE